MSDWIPTGAPAEGCLRCGYLDRGALTCAAYPAGPPLPIASSEVDHHVLRPGQVGTDVWTPVQAARPRRPWGLRAAAAEGDDQTDVVVTIGAQRHGINVTVFMTQRSHRITVPLRVQRRLRRWARHSRVALHTVAFDMRALGLYSGHGYYYARGIKSMTLQDMTQVRDAAHLRELVRGADVSLL